MEFADLIKSISTNFFEAFSMLLRCKESEFVIDVSDEVEFDPKLILRDLPMPKKHRFIRRMRLLSLWIRSKCLAKRVFALLRFVNGGPAVFCGLVYLVFQIRDLFDNYIIFLPTDVLFVRHIY